MSGLQEARMTTHDTQFRERAHTGILYTPPVASDHVRTCKGSQTNPGLALCSDWSSNPGLALRSDWSSVLGL